MKTVAIGADISKNDVSVSDSLIKNIEKDIPNLIDLGAINAGLTNVTGDDIVISAFVEDKDVPEINAGIIEILKNNAENIGDLEGISSDIKTAGEGVSYAEVKIHQDRFPDAIIIAFDTYGGEGFVSNVANSTIEAATIMKDITDISGRIENKAKEIPGVGFVGAGTDDPVVVATVENIEAVGVVSGAMMGAALGNKNVYLGTRGTPCNMIPGSVLLTATAFMNGNIIDLAVPFAKRTEILR